MRLVKRRSNLQDGSKSSPSRTHSTASLPSAAASSTDITLTPASTRPSSPVDKRQSRSFRKRNTTGEKSYPPSSFASGSGHGWSFGRMRSFKGRKRRESSGDATSESEAESEANKASSSPLPRSSVPPLQPVPRPALPLSEPSPMAAWPAHAPFSSSSQSGLHVSNSQVGLALSTDDLPTAVSYSRVVSPDVSQSCRQSSPLAPVAQESSSSKLTKRRPKSMVTDKTSSPVNALSPSPNDPTELQLRRARSSSTSPSNYPRSPPQILTLFANAGGSPIPAVPPLPSLSPIINSLPLPEGAAPADPEYVSSLNRNPSSVTSHGSASSAAYPSTEESALIVTPSDRSQRDTMSSSMWDSLRGTELAKIPFEGIDGYHDHDGDMETSRMSSNSPMSKGGSSKTATPNGSIKALRIKTSAADLGLQTFADSESPKITPRRIDRLASPLSPSSPLETMTPLNGDTFSDDFSTPARVSRLSRPRAASFANSLGTNSIYSLGEVATATPAVVTRAQQVLLSPSHPGSTGARRSSAPEEHIAGLVEKPEGSPRSHSGRRVLGDVNSSSPQLGYPIREYHSRPAPIPPHLSPNKQDRPQRSPRRSSLPRNGSFSASAGRESLRVATSQDATLPSSPGEQHSDQVVEMERTLSIGNMLRRMSIGKSPKKRRRHKSSMSVADDVDGEGDGAVADGEASGPGEPNEWGVGLGLGGVPQMKEMKRQSFGSALKRKSGIFTAAPELQMSIGAESPVKGGSARPAIVPARKATSEKETASTKISRSKSLPGQKRSPPSAQEVPTARPFALVSTDLVPATATPSSGASRAELAVPRMDSSSSAETGEPYGENAGATRSVSFLSDQPQPYWPALLGPYTPPELLSLPSYFHTAAPTRPYSPSAPSSPRNRTRHLGPDDHERHAHEVRRRYRQSLVHIKDDREFAHMLEEFARIENDPRARKALGGGISLVSPEASNPTSAEEGEDDGHVLMRSKGRDREGMEKKAKQASIAAWFVTREIVQGESRHAKLLAKGLRVAKAMAATNKFKGKDFAPPSPVTPAARSATFGSRSALESPSPAVPSVPRQKSHYRTGSVPSILKKRRNSLTDRNPQLLAGSLHALTPSPTALRNPGFPPSPTPISTSSTTLSSQGSAAMALNTLIARLPTLLDLSIKLSNAFSNDASPYGVSQAFIEMEEDMSREVGLWASEVGGVVISGIMEDLNRAMDEERRRGRGVEEEIDGEEGDERLGYLDIIMMPVQRASRYKLLFQELSTKIPPASTTHHKILGAIESSRKLASTLDTCQAMDLELLRRQGSRTKSLGKKVRPVSIGPGSKSSSLWNGFND
ncbi:hypothetical protein, variant [Cryptococcus amylolentus CBS 6039]|uniref:DH domain-containing protein n=1 Tax=Cryptococcus amylolentus CBS 6039 TaxID=1295533 RepID=A0A1E3HQ58_9TREE|nr:hypothetical protein L202_04129 [Cryptococcus amylolentus CBS 6039]XP_018993547.1 hypothetical protein, variant [Cryptococcus amylolentus CBS 6039]ODN78500.1 hypothetical protein L202_04129 [Cryptococcus amylolentus CBS 6039]ODN78501.1 hypothetical protein, variant [Cryptococcus amylolentus CBS 6039]